MASKIPAIPSIDGNIEKRIRDILYPIKEIIEIREGRRGSTGEDALVSTSDFISLFASYFATYSSALLDYTIYSHATSYAILYSELNSFHLFTGAATATLPELITGYEGKWVDIRKRTSADIIVNCSGSDVIVEAGTTSLQNTNPTENWASIRFVAESIGVWGIDKQIGSWSI